MEKSRIKMIVSEISHSTLPGCSRPHYDICAGIFHAFDATCHFHTLGSVRDQPTESNKEQSALKAHILASEVRGMKHGHL